MAEKKTSTRGDWLRPAFLAPAALILVLGFVGTCCGGGEMTARLGLGIRALILAPLVGLTYGVVLVLVDGALWLLRLRKLPTGFSAWLSASIATIAGSVVAGLTQAALKGAVSEETFAFVVLALVCACAVATRLAIGSKPTSGG
jgi:hypothetical protein